MSDIIAYDHSVKDYIAKLNATGHVTHSSYRKTSVTLHHNAGRLTHEGVLSGWKTRPASAHFDVDSAGAVAQYVKVNEYAWAVGNRVGNESSISIEMCNETLAPEWAVSSTTWESAARLAGWLFAHVIQAKPTTSNFFMHKHWSATECPGPYMSRIFESETLPAVQKAYESFIGSSIGNSSGPSSSGSTAEIADEVIAGKWGDGVDRVARLTKAGYDAAAIQAEVNKQLS